MTNERPVLVTGVAGFIGSHVATALRTTGIEVVGVDSSGAGPEGLSRYASMLLPDPVFSELLEETQPRALVHCAGRASVAGSISDPGDDYRVNTTMTFETLDAVRTRVPDCHVLFPSSAAVYGDPSSLPVTEDAALRPLSPYGFHKAQAETLCREAAELHGMTTTILRIFSAYGPGLRRQVLWDICTRALTSDAVTLHGTGTESRDFVFVEDIADAFVTLIARATTPGHATFNLGSGIETSIEQLARNLVTVLGVDVPVVFDGDEVPGDPKHWRADIGHIEAIGWAPTTTLEQGIAALAPWARTAILGG